MVLQAWGPDGSRRVRDAEWLAAPMGLRFAIPQERREVASVCLIDGINDGARLTRLTAVPTLPHTHLPQWAKPCVVNRID